MVNTYTRQYLTSLLFAQGRDAQLVTPCGKPGTLLGIEREDGSGKSFNVEAMLNNGDIVSFYIRTEHS